MSTPGLESANEPPPYSLNPDDGLVDSGVWDCFDTFGPAAGSTVSRFGLVLTHTPSEGSRLGRLFDRGPREHLKWAWADCRMPQSANGVATNTYESRRGMAAAYCQMKGARTRGSRTFAPTFDDSSNGVRAFSWRSQEWADDAAWLSQHGNNFQSVFGSINNPISAAWSTATTSTSLGIADPITGRSTSWGMSFSVMCFDKAKCHPFSIKDTQLTQQMTGSETNALALSMSDANNLNVYDNSRQFSLGSAQTFTVGMSLVSFFFDGHRYYVRVNGVGMESETLNHPNYKFSEAVTPATLTAGTSMLQMGYFVGIINNFRIFVGSGVPDDVNYHMDRELEHMEMFSGHMTGPMLRLKQTQAITRSFSMQFTVVIGAVSVEGQDVTLIQVGDGTRGVSLPEVILTHDMRLKACYSTDNTDPHKTSCVQTDPLATGASYGTDGWPSSVVYGQDYGPQSRSTLSSGAAYRAHLRWIVDDTGVGRWDSTQYAGGWRAENLEVDEPHYWGFGCHNDHTVSTHCTDPDIRLTWSSVAGTATELPHTQQKWGSNEPVGMPGPLRRTPGHAIAFLRNYKYMPSGLGCHIDASELSPSYDDQVPRTQRASPWLGLYDKISGIPVSMKSTGGPPGPPLQYTMASTGKGTSVKDNTAASTAATYLLINSHKFIAVSKLNIFDTGSRLHLWNPVAPTRAYTLVISGWSMASRWSYSSGTYNEAWGGSTWGGSTGDHLGLPWQTISTAWETGAPLGKWGTGNTDNDLRIMRSRRMVHSGLGPVQVAITLIDTGTSLEFKGRVHHLTNNNGDYLYTHYITSGRAYQFMKDAGDFSSDGIPIGRYLVNGNNNWAMIEEIEPFNHLVGGMADFKWYDRSVSDSELNDLYRNSKMVTGLTVLSSYADHPDGISVHYWGMGAQNQEWVTPSGTTVNAPTQNMLLRRCARKTQNEMCAHGYGLRDAYVDPRNGENLNCYVRAKYYIDGCYAESLSFNLDAEHLASPTFGINFNHRRPGGVGYDSDRLDHLPTSMLSLDEQTSYIMTESLDGCKRECEHVMCRMLTFMRLPGGSDDKTCLVFQTVKSRHAQIRTRWTIPTVGTVHMGRSRHSYHEYFTPYRTPGDPGYNFTTLIASHRLVHSAAEAMDEERFFGDLFEDLIPALWWKGAASSDTSNYLKYGSVLHWHRDSWGGDGLKGVYYNEPQGRTFLFLDESFSYNKLFDQDDLYDQIHGGYHADQKCASICQNINTQPNGGYVDRTRFDRNDENWQTPLFCYGYSFRDVALGTMSFYSETELQVGRKIHNASSTWTAVTLMAT